MNSNGFKDIWEDMKNALDVEERLSIREVQRLRVEIVKFEESMREDARTLKFQGISLADPDECFNAVRELAIQTNQVDELSKVLVTMLLIQKPSTWSKYVKLAVATVLGDKNADDAAQHSGFDFKSYLEKVRASELPIIEFTDLHK